MATAIFAELQSALDRTWRTPTPAGESGVGDLIRTRLLSFGLVLGPGFLFVVSLVVSAGLAALGKLWGGWFESWDIFLEMVDLRSLAGDLHLAYRDDLQNHAASSHRMA